MARISPIDPELTILACRGHLHGAEHSLPRGTRLSQSVLSSPPLAHRDQWGTTSPWSLRVQVFLGLLEELGGRAGKRCCLVLVSERRM